MPRLFRKDNEPKCQYCALGKTGTDKTTIMCERFGFMSPEDSCGKFVYDPLKRQPRVMRDLPSFDEKDFSIDE